MGKRRNALVSILFFIAISPSLIGIYYSMRLDHRQQRAEPEPSRDYADCRDPICCMPWSWNTDNWWMNHPHYILGDQNISHTCFELSKERQPFLQHVHQLQQQCANTVHRQQISSGYAAALSETTRSFWSAVQHNQAFALRRPHAKFRWNFAVADSNHWAYCPTRDMECFYLPLGSCATTNTNVANKAKKSHLQEYKWLRQYAFRFRHVFRRKLQEYLKDTKMPSTPCTAIHVRRGDIAYGRGRRYAAVGEYLELVNTSNVVLLTDDDSVIQEVKTYLLKEYQWTYLKRPRVQGPSAGFEAFVPSKDPAQEVLAIAAESALASRCHTLVHGKSGFAEVILDVMPQNTTKIVLDIQLNKGKQPKVEPKDRAKAYLGSIEEWYSKHHHVSR